MRFRPELGFSTKRVIGPVITLFKQFLLKLLFFVFDDLAKQVDTAIRRIEIASTVESGARVAGDELLDARLVSEIGAREALAHRLAETDHRIERLQLEPRLARLERCAAPPSMVSTPRSTRRLRPKCLRSTTSGSRTDFVPRPRYESVNRRTSTCCAAKAVVDLGCGRGELIDMLREEGVSAYGVEIDPDFIAILEENQIEVVAKDAVAHLEELAPGIVNGIVGSHLVEHLPPAAVSRLVALAGEKLAEDGSSSWRHRIPSLSSPDRSTSTATSRTSVRSIRTRSLSSRRAPRSRTSRYAASRRSPMTNDSHSPATGDST